MRPVRRPRGSLDLFTITGGGATFQLGPDVNITNQETLGIANVQSRNLGTSEYNYTDADGNEVETLTALDDLASGRLLNLVSGDLGDAQKVVDSAIAEVAGLRGRLGSFQKNTIGATIRSLGVAFENVSAAESSIRDTDFAEETAALTRSQILQQAATNSLGIANAQPQAVLSLLR